MESRTFTDEIAYERGHGLTYEAVKGEHHTWNGPECECCGATRVNPFTDVPESDFYFEAALWALEKGITNGLAANIFGSHNICNRAHIVTFMYRSQ